MLKSALSLVFTLHKLGAAHMSSTNMNNHQFDQLHNHTQKNIFIKHRVVGLFSQISSYAFVVDINYPQI